MSARILGVFSLLILPLLLSGVAGAQQATPTPGTNLEKIVALEQTVDHIRGQMVTKTDLTAATEMITQEVRALLQQVDTNKDSAEFVTKEELEQKLKPIWDLLEEHEGDLKTLREDFGELGDLVRQEHGTILKAISKRDDQDRPVLNLRHMMDSSSDFRDEFSGVMHDSMDQRGTLAIENQTGIWQRLRVVNNGLTYDIPPGPLQRIEVPVGTVTTELVNHERPRNWTVGPPNYEQRIVIKRTSPIWWHAARPPAVEPPAYVGPMYVDRPVYVERPLYVDPPLYIEPLWYSADSWWILP